MLVNQVGWKWYYYTGTCYTTHNCGYGIGYQYKLFLLPKLHIFLSQWLRNDCSSSNRWCSEADIDRSGRVDLLDFGLYSYLWGEQ